MVPKSTSDLEHEVSTMPLLHALLIVGGDGTVNDVINYLLLRNDWVEAAQLPIGKKI